MFNPVLKYLFVAGFLHIINAIVCAQPQLTLPTNDTSICSGQTITVEINVTGTPPVYVIYLHNGVPTRVDGAANSLSIIDLTIGTYNFIEYGDATNTVISTTDSVVIHQFPDVNVYLTGGGGFCENEQPIPIQVNFSGTPNFKLICEVNNIVREIDSDGSTYVFGTSDNLNVELQKITDKNCTKSIDLNASINLISIPKPNIYGLDTLCMNSKQIYSTEFNPYTHNWNIPEGAIYIDGYNSQGQFVYVQWVKEGKFDVMVQLADSENECYSDLALKEIVVKKLPEVNPKIDTSNCFDVNPSFTFTINLAANESIFWPSLNSTSPTVVFVEKGNYNYLVTNNESCVDTGRLSVVNICSSELHVPDAFTPNNDGINDRFTIYGIFFGLEFKIFSNSGLLLYTMIQGDSGWDGEFQGNKMPEGTYFWQVRYADILGNEYTKNGKLVLIR